MSESPKKPKGNPIPVRFEPDEDATLTELSKRSGVDKAKLIRRAVSILLEEVKKRGGKVGWISDELDLEQKIISLPKIYMDRALHNATARGFANFSDYITWLIERDPISDSFLKEVLRAPELPALRAAEDPPDKT